MPQDQYRFEIAGDKVVAMFEWDDGLWQTEQLDSNEVATVDKALNVTVTENNGTYLEVKVYSPTGTNGIYTLTSETYTGLDGKLLPTEPSSDDLFRFDIADGKVKAMYELDDGLWQTEHLDSNEVATVDKALNVTVTENNGTYLEVKVYSPTGADGNYILTSETYTDLDGKLLPAEPSSSSDDLYRFDIADGKVKAMYELDDGLWQTEHLDSNEVATVDKALNVTVTENNGTYLEVKVYSPTGADGNYTLTSETYTDLDGKLLAKEPSEDDEDGDGYDDDDLDHDGSEDDVLDGTDSDDHVLGKDGNDTLRGKGGNDSLDGGAGLDVAQYSAGHKMFSVSISATGAKVTSNGGSDGMDSLQNVERVGFSDGTLALDIGKWQTSGEAFRLYQAAFARSPDLDGLKYWIGQMDGGQTHEQVAHNFIAAQEFQAKYGAGLTNGQLVTALYQNVLGRVADQGGYNYWLDLLDNGKMTREQALINFSESDENVTLVGASIQDGIWLG